MNNLLNFTQFTWGKAKTLPSRYSFHLYHNDCSEKLNSMIVKSMKLDSDHFSFPIFKVRRLHIPQKVVVKIN